ncbi:hypothetical protein D3C87_1717450 [compost metagenome]
MALVVVTTGTFSPILMLAFSMLRTRIFGFANTLVLPRFCSRFSAADRSLRLVTPILPWFSPNRSPTVILPFSPCGSTEKRKSLG